MTEAKLKTLKLAVPATKDQWRMIVAHSDVVSAPNDPPMVIVRPRTDIPAFLNWLARIGVTAWEVES